jgi:4-hydroxybenzoate polyprenyltransferase
MQLHKLLQISRPRFWMYTVWPFLIGIAATWSVLTFFDKLQWSLAQGDTPWVIGSVLAFLVFLTYVFYFLFPGNLLIYGVNDIADWDTDQYNTKKQWYEQRLTQPKKTLIYSILKRWLYCVWVVIILGIGLAINENYPPLDLPQRAATIIPHWTTQSLFTLFLNTVEVLNTLPVWIAFFFTSIFYSLAPIRAKSKPFLDGLFNVLYIIPWLIAYLTFGGTVWTISRIWFGAARLRCMSMHTYSAIPDITPDSQANLTTTAVLLWPKNTLFYCWALRILSSILAVQVVGPIAYIFGAIYVGLILISFTKPVMQVYTWFPRINAIVGFILFRIVVYL